MVLSYEALAEDLTADDCSSRSWRRAAAAIVMRDRAEEASSTRRPTRDRPSHDRFRSSASGSRPDACHAATHGLTATGCFGGSSGGSYGASTVARPATTAPCTADRPRRGGPREYMPGDDLPHRLERHGPDGRPYVKEFFEDASSPRGCCSTRRLHGLRAARTAQGPCADRARHHDRRTSSCAAATASAPCCSAVQGLRA